MSSPSLQRGTNTAAWEKGATAAVQTGVDFDRPLWLDQSVAADQFKLTEHELLVAYLSPGTRPRLLPDARHWLLQKLGRRLPGTNADLADLGQGHLELPGTWKSEGLFGAVGDQPRTVKVLGEGYGKGSHTRYSRKAIARLDYVATGAAAGLGPKRIKAALGAGIPREDLGICADLQTWRYALTLPLVLLLNGQVKDQDTERRRLLFDRIWRWTPASEKAYARLRTASPAVSRDELDDQFERAHRARDAFPLSLLLFPPWDAKSCDYFAGVADAGPLLDAMRRIVSDPPSAPPADYDLVEQRALKEYRVTITASGDKHVVYTGEIDEPRRPMTMLEQAASHLLNIGDEIDRWVRICRRVRPEGGTCGRFFALAHTDQTTCQTSACRLQNVAPEP